MLKTIILYELKKEILSLRLQITFLLFTAIFIIGSIAFIHLYSNEKSIYRKDFNKYIEDIRQQSESNLTRLATTQRDYVMEPRNNSFISDAKEKFTPNQITYSAYNVFNFSTRQGSINRYMNPFQELNWVFIISCLIGFTVLLLSFDALSGEKESRTLALTFSNPVPRFKYLAGKYLSIVIISLIAVLPGLCISLIIILFSGTVVIHAILIFEIITFLLGAGLYIACMAAIGMLCSAFSKSSNVSLLYALSFWILFTLVIPGLSILYGDLIIPVEKANVIEQRRAQAWEAINDDAPPGSWSANGGNPFYPRHELRARNLTNLMNSDKAIHDAYYLTLFRQYEEMQALSMLSPVSAFEFYSEAMTDAGFVRFRKTWNDLHIYQEQFLKFFKNKDANDPKSPHWYNPNEDLSTTAKPVNFEEVPLFGEKTMTLRMRMAASARFAGILVCYTLLFFFFTALKFRRYDVR
jgi:ABC-type transport system involved in multi-copper enzyme maturation permease subunit